MMILFLLLYFMFLLILKSIPCYHGRLYYVSLEVPAKVMYWDVDGCYRS